MAGPFEQRRSTHEKLQHKEMGGWGWEGDGGRDEEEDDDVGHITKEMLST